jgi:hypothetical protein
MKWYWQVVLYTMLLQDALLVEAFMEILKADA